VSECTICALPRAAEQIILIRQRNEDLIILANGGRESISGSSSGSSNSPTISHSLIKYHQRVQRHARLLYSTLREKLESPICKCGAPHSAHLELKMRGTPPTKALAKSQANLPNRFFTFSLMFSTQQSGHDQPTAMCHWQEFQLEPIDSCRVTDSTLDVKSAAATQLPPVEITLPLPPNSPRLPIAIPTSERGRPDRRAAPQALSPSPMR